MQNIYIIKGTTGLYEDHHVWSVAAYTDKSNAELHSELAQKRGDEIYAQMKRDCSYGDTDDNQHDPLCDIDYNGVHYYVVEVPLLDAVPGAAYTDWAKEQQEVIEPMYRQWIVTIAPDTDHAYTQLYVFPKPTSKTDVWDILRESECVSTTDIKAVPSKDQVLRWSTQDPRWEVYSRTGASLDTVHYPAGYTKDKVRTSLVNEYGYPAGITVKKCK